ncbi:MAG: hypothetical protein AAGF11_26710 [Myxococcota bacterium]
MAASSSWRLSTLTRIVFAVSFGVAIVSSCSRNIPEDPPQEDDLLERRVDSCRALCNVQVGDCGPFPNEFIESLDQCVHECASANGDLSGGWGYQIKTEIDACASEWKEHADCIIALSCDEQRIYWRPVEEDPPQSERSCYAEWSRMMQCVVEHPCCEEG